MSRHLNKLIIAAAALLALAGTASASHHPVDLPVLSASVQGDDLRVDYRFGQGSWQQVQRYGINPVLHVYVAQASGRYARVISAPLMQQNGRLNFADHTRLHGLGMIRLEVAGTRQGHSIASRPVYQPVYETPVYGPAPPYYTPAPPASTPVAQTDTLDSIQSACAKHVSSSVGVTNCVARARSLALAEQTVRACGHSTTQDAGFFTCLDEARFLDNRAPEVVHACNEAFDGDANTVACMRMTRNNPYAARDILSCSIAGNGDTRFECIEDTGHATHAVAAAPARPATVPAARPVVVTPGRPVYTTPAYQAPRPTYTPARRRPAPKRTTWSASASARFGF